MKIINITCSDLDGAVSAILVKEYARQKNIPCDIIKGRYDTIETIFSDNYSKENYIIITDMTMKNEPEWIGNVTNVLLIDHHNGSDKSRIKNKVVDSAEGTSACKLVYDYFTSKGCVYDDKFKKLMELGHDFDSYTHSLATSKALNYLYYLYYFERFVDRFKSGFVKFSKDELTFIKCKINEIKNSLTKLEFNAINDDVAFIVSDDNITEITEELLTNRGFMYVFVYSPVRKALSLRSSNSATINCGEFLEIFDGGGHKFSGGIRIKDMKEIDDILKGFEVAYEEFHSIF